MGDAERKDRSGTIVVCLVAIGITICAVYVFFCCPDVVAGLSSKKDDPVLQGKLEELESQNADLTQQVADIQAKLEDAMGENVKLRGENETLADEVLAKQATITGLEGQNLHLSDTMAAQPQWEKKATGFHFSTGIMAGTPVMRWKPEVNAIIGAGKGHWQVLTGVGYSEDGPKVSVGFQWTW